MDADASPSVVVVVSAGVVVEPSNAVDVEPVASVVLDSALVDVVDSGSSGSVTTVVVTGTVVEVVGSGSTGSRGSRTVVEGTAGPAVVTDPDVEPSVDGGWSDRSGLATGDVVLGAVEAPGVVGPEYVGIHVGEVPGDDGICSDDPEVSLESTVSVDGRSALGGSELTDGGGSSVSGGAVGGGVGAVAGVCVPVGADETTGSSSVESVTIAVDSITGSGSVSISAAVDRWVVTPPTSGPSSVESEAGPTLTSRASMAWYASGPAMAATDIVDNTTASASRDDFVGEGSAFG